LSFSTANAETPLSAESPPVRAGAFDPLELYAAAMDASDYVAAVAPLIRRAAPDIGDLLDVGAGGGQLGHALRPAHARWTAIEPSATMRSRLLRFSDPPVVLPCGWETSGVASGAHDTVLAATMPATMDNPEKFLKHCRRWARRQVVWVVPAQNGPRGLCFAGCLPHRWHGEDETPGVDVTLRGLPPAEQPHHIDTVEWTFSGVVESVDELAGFLADRLGWAVDDVRRLELAKHLAAQAKPHAKGFCLEIARRSAVLVWRA
jgi:SAM-dependent methyltransferase